MNNKILIQKYSSKPIINFHSNVTYNIDQIKDFDTITFDDGLFIQIDKIKEFSKYKPVYFFPSGFLTRISKPIFVENSLVHKTLEQIMTTKEYLNKEHPYFNIFMSQEEIENLLLLPNVNFGIHGYHHLNMNFDNINITLSKKYKMIKEDANDSAKYYLNLIKKYPSKFITEDLEFKKLTLNFCTPYNIYNDLQEMWITIFLKKISLEINELYSNISITLFVFSNERIDIEDIKI